MSPDGIAQFLWDIRQDNPNASFVDIAKAFANHFYKDDELARISYLNDAGVTWEEIAD